MISSWLAENTLSESESRLLGRMKKTGVKAEITVRKAAAVLGMSETDARKVLNKLAGKGYLKIEKGLKQYVYRLEPEMQFDY